MAFFGFGNKKKVSGFEDLEKELGLPKEIGGMPEEPKEDFSADLPSKEPDRPAFKEEGFKEELELKEIPKEEPLPQKELELISAKLDAIRLMIDNMDQRVRHIERMEEEQAKKKRTW